MKTQYISINYSFNNKNTPTTNINSNNLYHPHNIKNIQTWYTENPIKFSKPSVFQNH